jgi:hypothetical protein
LLLGSGCKPTIASFRAQPSFICTNTSAQLVWSASAGGQIVDTSSGVVIVKTSASGSTTVTPTQPARYRLDAVSRFGTTSRETDVNVAGGMAQELGASVADPSARCNNAMLTVTAEAKPEFWDARVHAGSVAALGNLPLHVEHAGARVDIPVGSSTDAFKDSTVLGTWTISFRLPPGQSCGPGLPRNLAVKVSPTCSP